MPPEGCICIEDQIYVYEGIRIMGLGGCQKYKEGFNFYTEKEMKKRVGKLWFQLRKHKGIDILLTHAPAYRLNDMEHLTHRGFQCFIDVIEKYELYEYDRHPEKYVIKKEDDPNAVVQRAFKNSNITQ